jgi:cytidylate kinase
MFVVTLSAAYGAGGTVIGPAVAKRLGVPFVDRAIPAQVANDLGVPLEHAMSRDEQVKGWLHRLLASAASMSGDYLIGYDPPRTALLPDTEFVACTQSAIRDTIKNGGGVILGRAGAVVLRGHPGALHVRLDGAPERRVHQVMRELNIGESEARDHMELNDRARTAYVRHFYREDAANPSLYHLSLDSTRIPLDTCVDLITMAAKAGKLSIK